MSETANTPTPLSPSPQARKKGPAVEFVDNGGSPTALAGAAGFRIGDWLWLLPSDGSERLFALFGAAALALPIAKKWESIGADATAALAARFAAITPTTWGDEKATKVKADPEARKRAALDELVSVIATCKQAAGLAFDEPTVRLKLADPAFARKVRKEPHIAAEIARRAGAQPSADTLAGL